MKLLRITCLVIFLLSTVVFLGFRHFETVNQDISGPEITFKEEMITVSVTASDEELLKDVTAFDEKDGDVTASLLVESISNLVGNGNRIITYIAFDSDNNITKRDRELVYNDYTSPRFSSTEPFRFTVGDTENILRNVTVYDCIDGDLTDKIKFEEPDYYFGRSEGIEQIDLLVKNSAGDIANLPVDIEFYYNYSQDRAHTPEILLNHYITYIKTEDVIDSRSYLKGVIIGKNEYDFTDQEPDVYNGNIISKNDITITSNIDRKVAGVYSIEYSLSTEEGYTGKTKLIVVVEE